jgi:hypothetical protein
MLSPMGTFDTALMEALLSVGISPERARAVVESFERSIDERYSLHAQVLATKRDLAELETRLSREIGACRERIAAGDARVNEVNAGLVGRINEVNATLSGRINEVNANLSARIAESKTELLKWMLAALTAQTALLAGIVKLL